MVKSPYCFIPDEEIGHVSVDKVNLEKVSAKAAYTLDGGELGSLEDETQRTPAPFT